jgi:hypothetical protein
MANEGLRELAEVMKGLLAEFTPSDNPIIVKLTQEEAQKYAVELGEQFNPESMTLTATPELLKRTVFAIPCISALDGDNQAKSQQMLQLMQVMQPYLQINPQTGLPIGWRDPGQNTVLPNIGYFIREYARLNKMELRDALTVIPAQQVQAAQQQQQQQAMQMQAMKGGGAPGQGQQPTMNGPAEVAGQSMLTSPAEQQNQQAGIEQMLNNS